MKATLGIVVMAVMLGACGSTPIPTAGSGSLNPGELGGVRGPTPLPRGVDTPRPGNDFHEVGVEVRVANFDVPKSSTTGATIDVWAGDPDRQGSSKLGTVDYGQVSPILKVTTPNRPGQAAGKHDPYILTFYPAGRTGTNDKLIEKSETASPHQKVIAVLVPQDPRFDGASIQMLFDEVGDDPPSNYKRGPLPTAAPGKALAEVNAIATEFLGSDPAHGPNFVAGTPGKGCAAFYSSPPDVKLHTYSENGGTVVGGTGSVVYEVDQGAPFAVYMEGRQQSPIDACRTNPPLGPVDLGLATGGRAHVFVNGTALSALNLLVVPV